MRDEIEHKRRPAGCIEVQNNSEGFAIGATRRMLNIPGGGGPDGLWWTVVDAGEAEHSEATDDTRVGREYFWAWVRPATETEVAPILERRARKNEEKAKAEEARRPVERDLLNFPFEVVSVLDVPRIDERTEELWASSNRRAVWTLRSDGHVYRSLPTSPDYRRFGPGVVPLIRLAKELGMDADQPFGRAAPQ